MAPKIKFSQVHNYSEELIRSILRETFFAGFWSTHFLNGHSVVVVVAAVLALDDFVVAGGCDVVVAVAAVVVVFASVLVLLLLML